MTIAPGFSAGGAIAAATTGIGGERRRQHDEIGAGDCGGGIVGRGVGDPETAHRFQSLGAAGAGGDVRRRVVAPDHPRQRGADQPDPDDRDAVEKLFLRSIQPQLVMAG